MPQAKIVSEQELKRALAVVAARRFAERDTLDLLMTYWTNATSKRGANGSDLVT